MVFFKNEGHITVNMFLKELNSEKVQSLLKKIKHFHGVLPPNHTLQAILQMERKQKYFLVTKVDNCNKEGSHWMVFEKMLTNSLFLTIYV